MYVWALFKLYPIKWTLLSLEKRTQLYFYSIQKIPPDFNMTAKKIYRNGQQREFRLPVTVLGIGNRFFPPFKAQKQGGWDKSLSAPVFVVRLAAHVS